AKEALSNADEVAVSVHRPDGSTFRGRLSRAELEALVRPVLERCGPPVRRALKDAAVTAADLTGVIRVGGAKRMPLVRRQERELVADCRSLARFKLTGIPPLPAGMVRLEVTFLVDADGILRVSAREEATGKETSIEVKPSYGLTDEEVERMLLDSFAHGDED